MSYKTLQFLIRQIFVERKTTTLKPRVDLWWTSSTDSDRV